MSRPCHAYVAQGKGCLIGWGSRPAVFWRGIDGIIHGMKGKFCIYSVLLAVACGAFATSDLMLLKGA